MRGAVQYVLFSGIAWFVAGAIFLAAIGIDLARWKRAERATRFALVLAMAIALLCGTALPWWLALPLCVAAVGYVFFAFGRRQVAVASLTALLVAAALVYEGLFFFRGPIVGPKPQRIVVVGDSLSSGGFGEPMAWPEILSRDAGINVENFSQASETVRSALTYQAPKLSESTPDLVIIELGGNDMLGGTPAADYARDLDRLLAVARSHGRVVMFELPILPGKWPFGSHQRRLARKHRVPLVPKRVLAKLLSTDGNVTDDALHLSERGHEVMGEEVRRWLRL